MCHRCYEKSCLKINLKNFSEETTKDTQNTHLGVKVKKLNSFIK